MCSPIACSKGALLCDTHGPTRQSGARFPTWGGLDEARRSVAESRLNSGPLRLFGRQVACRCSRTPTSRTIPHVVSRLARFRSQRLPCHIWPSSLGSPFRDHPRPCARSEWRSLPRSWDCLVPSPSIHCHPGAHPRVQYVTTVCLLSRIDRRLVFPDVSVFLPLLSVAAHQTTEATRGDPTLTRESKSTTASLSHLLFKAGKQRDNSHIVYLLYSSHHDPIVLDNDITRVR